MVPDGKRKTDPVGSNTLSREGQITSEFDSVPIVNGHNPRLIHFTINNGRKIEIVLDRSICLGRSDPISNLFPEIDLTDDGGAEKGVSRRHVRISKYEENIVVEDLGSTNGTYVNEKKLGPYLSQVISNGDHLRLGGLSIEVEFP